MDGPALLTGALNTIGINFDSWDEHNGIRTTGGAVFFMDPDHGATVDSVVFAQLTVPTGTVFTGTLNAKGRSISGEHGWKALGLQLSPV